MLLSVLVSVPAPVDTGVSFAPASCEALADAALPPLKSVVYQPVPLRAKPAAVTCLL